MNFVKFGRNYLDVDEVFGIIPDEKKARKVSAVAKHGAIIYFEGDEAMQLYGWFEDEKWRLDNDPPQTLR